jgi:thiol-disulfide isomerase/thioredoxin
VAVAVLALAAAGGFAWRRRDGRLKGARERMLTMADLGQPLGARATLLQFSSSFCAPCRAARQMLADVATRADGVAHVEINVADRLDLVRLLDVRRTPTVFVLGPQGQITRRASGLPRREDVLAAVALATGEPPAEIYLPPRPAAPPPACHPDFGRDSGHGLA